MRTFTTLADAVRFLADALECGDDAAVAGACREPPDAWVLDRLRQRNAATPLGRLYAWRRFPWFAKTFKLGGHDKELGHIHIDFARCDGGWEIREIWMCR